MTNHRGTETPRIKENCFRPNFFGFLCVSVPCGQPAVFIFVAGVIR